MFQIVEKELSIRFPLRQHLHALTCQIPNYLELHNRVYRLANPEQNWLRIQSIIHLTITGHGNLKKSNFLFFPESMLPFDHFEEALCLMDRMRPNMVTVIGLGPINLGEYRDLLQRFAENNQEALDSVLRILIRGTLKPFRSTAA